MSEEGDDELVLTSPARRALADTLPEAVAAAVIGVWSARRGTYRVLYRLQNERHEVVVLRVEHRREAYRRR